MEPYQGLSCFVPGSEYDGMWVRGKRHGPGKLTWSNGDVFEGIFADDKYKNGSYIWTKDGSSYAGQWHNERPHGQGKFTFANVMNVMELGRME